MGILGRFKKEEKPGEGTRIIVNTFPKRKIG